MAPPPRQRRKPEADTVSWAPQLRDSRLDSVIECYAGATSCTRTPKLSEGMKQIPETYTMDVLTKISSLFCMLHANIIRVPPVKTTDGIYMYME